jgi:two-component system sensor histidine kinase YesM
MGETSNFILTSQDGTIITQSVQELGISSSTFSHTRNLILTGWELTGYFHPSVIKKSTLSIITPIIIIMFSIAVVVLFVASFISYKITAPLHELASLMEVVRSGNFQVTMDNSGDDEVAMLGTSFNVMVSRIHTLMHDLHEEHEKLRISEIKTLEAQINPHFLYNTLDSIIWLSRKGQMEDVTRLVYSLSKLLRIGLNRGRTMVTIEEEIEHIRNYLVIQDIRYADDFTYKIDIPDSILKNKTLKLILQPLVENAIIHGVQQSDKPEKISISATENDADIFLFVSNTGTAVDAQTVDQINCLFEDGVEAEFGLGLHNVNQRIKLYFGKQYGLHFSSDNGKTTVSVHIPRI